MFSILFGDSSSNVVSPPLDVVVIPSVGVVDSGVVVVVVDDDNVVRSNAWVREEDNQGRFVS